MRLNFKVFSLLNVLTDYIKSIIFQPNAGMHEKRAF